MDLLDEVGPVQKARQAQGRRFSRALAPSGPPLGRQAFDRGVEESTPAAPLMCAGRDTPEA